MRCASRRSDGPLFHFEVWHFIWMAFLPFRFIVIDISGSSLITFLSFHYWIETEAKWSVRRQPKPIQRSAQTDWKTQRTLQCRRYDRCVIETINGKIKIHFIWNLFYIFFFVGFWIRSCRYVVCGFWSIGSRCRESVYSPNIRYYIQITYYFFHVYWWLVCMVSVCGGQASANRHASDSLN